VSFLAALAWQRWRRRSGISFSGLFVAPVTFPSGVIGEVAEIVLGVGWRRIGFR